MSKRFEPTKHPDAPNAFYQDEWAAYWSSLDEAERQSLRDKASWEHMSLSAVALEWGAVNVVRQMERPADGQTEEPS